MKKILVLLLTLLLLSGCTPKDPANSSPVFWIITEISTSDGMNYQAEAALETFREKYPDMEVKLEILPTDAQERELYIKKLRTKILAGEGPDVYLLPTSATLTVDADRKNHTDQVTVEPLFSDVTQAMYTGVFMDIGSYYEQDEELNTTALRREVMEAGVVGTARYVLPLRWNMPILLAEDGVNIHQTREELVRRALDTGDRALAVGLQLPTDLSAFPKLFNYESGQILVTREEIAEYLSLYQSWYAASHEAETKILNALETELLDKYNAATQNFFPDVLEELGITVSRDYLNSVNQYISSESAHWTTQRLPVFVSSLTNLLDNAILEQAMGQAFQEAPVLRWDGTIGAEVTYWGAVGAGCEDAEMAYDYLRLFLTEEYQWDGVRPRTDRSHAGAYSNAREVQNYGLVESSWPVRDRGAIPHFYETFQYRSYTIGRTLKEEGTRRAAIKAIEPITESGASVLDRTIDEVRFPIHMAEGETLADALEQLNDETGEPTNVDISKLAEDVYQNLWWHLAEG